jgi:hypothetical protein
MDNTEESFVILYHNNNNVFLKGYGVVIPLFSLAALGLTQPPIRWVPGALSLWVKRPGREANHSPPSSAEIKECVDLYLRFPNTSSWRGTQKKKAQGQLQVGKGTVVPVL